MNNIYINLKNENDQIKEEFKNKDLVTIDDLLNKIDDLKYELDHLQEEFDDYKREVEDNYKPLSIAEQIDISDRDFI